MFIPQYSLNLTKAELLSDQTEWQNNDCFLNIITMVLITKLSVSNNGEQYCLLISKYLWLFYT